MPKQIKALLTAENDFDIDKDHPASLIAKQIVRSLRAGGEAAEKARNTLSEVLAEQNNEALAEIVEMAITDHRTFLGSTMLLEHSLSDILDNSTKSALFITTDLVNFKHLINDRFGQSVGDEVIRLTSDALRSTIRIHPRTHNDSLFRIDRKDFEGSAYRIGGDEYAAILVDGENLKHADHEKILRNKIKAMLSGAELQDYLKELTVNGFGVRGSFCFIDRTIFKNYAQILKSADPKLNTVCEYILVAKDNGFTLKKVV